MLGQVEPGSTWGSQWCHKAHNCPISGPNAPGQRLKRPSVRVGASSMSSGPKPRGQGQGHLPHLHPSLLFFTQTAKENPFLYGISVQFSRSVVSDSLWPHGLQHARPPCPSPTLRVYSNSCPLSQWCHPTISSSVVPFSCLQSFPASGSFQMSQLFELGAQSIGVSASASVLPMNTQARTEFL